MKIQERTKLQLSRVTHLMRSILQSGRVGDVAQQLSRQNSLYSLFKINKKVFKNKMHESIQK